MICRRVLYSCFNWIFFSFPEPAGEDEMPPLEGEGEGEEDDARMEEVD